MAHRAYPPEQVLDRLVALRRAALARQQELASDLTTRLGSVYAHGRLQDDPLDYVEVLHDAEHAAHRIGQLVAAATTDVMYERSLLEDQALRDLVRAYAGLGEEVRIADRLPLKLAVIDGTSVAFSLPDPVGGRDRETTLIVHHRMLAATMLVAFESVWASATPLEEAMADAGPAADAGSAADAVQQHGIPDPDPRGQGGLQDGREVR